MSDTNTVTKKAYRVLSVISKSFECKNRGVSVRLYLGEYLGLYTTLVHPIIEYKAIPIGSCVARA